MQSSRCTAAASLAWRSMICSTFYSTRSKTRPHNPTIVNYLLPLGHSSRIDRFPSRPSKRTLRLCLGGSGRGSVMGLHARDLMGIMLMLLVFTEATRKYMTMKDLAKMQAEAELRLTSMFELNSQLQFASRRLLAPPAVKTNDGWPLLCQSPGMDCLPGEEVRCEMGKHEGCDCEYIQSCFPRASQCTFFNATHDRTCGF